MMGDGKHNPEEIDPEKLTRLLELELMQKRAGWQQKKARRGSLRALSFLFLFAIVAASLVGYFLFFNPGRVREMPSTTVDSVTPTPTSSPR